MIHLMLLKFSELVGCDAYIVLVMSAVVFCCSILIKSEIYLTFYIFSLEA